MAIRIGTAACRTRPWGRKNSLAAVSFGTFPSTRMAGPDKPAGLPAVLLAQTVCRYRS